MPKTTNKHSVKTLNQAANGQPENGAKPKRPRRKKHKPFDEMTLEELTIYGFQLAYDSHQRRLREQQQDDTVHT